MFSLTGEQYATATLGSRVRMIRNRRGLTQAQLAEHLDIDPTWVSKVEAGKISPTPFQLRGLCLLLDVDPAVLLDL